MYYDPFDGFSLLDQPISSVVSTGGIDLDVCDFDIDSFNIGPEPASFSASSSPNLNQLELAGSQHLLYQHQSFLHHSSVASLTSAGHNSTGSSGASTTSADSNTSGSSSSLATSINNNNNNNNYSLSLNTHLSNPFLISDANSSSLNDDHASQLEQLQFHEQLAAPPTTSSNNNLIHQQNTSSNHSQIINSHQQQHYLEQLHLHEHLDHNHYLISNQSTQLHNHYHSNCLNSNNNNNPSYLEQLQLNEHLDHNHNNLIQSDNNNYTTSNFQHQTSTSANSSTNPLIRPEANKRSVLMNLLIDGSDVGAGYTLPLK